MAFLKEKILSGGQSRSSLWILIVFCGFFSGGAISLRTQETKLNHQGFQVDFAQINDSPQKETILKAVKRQIEIVVLVGLSEENLNFFKSVPIVMIPDASGTPGVYGGIKNTVFLKGRDLAPMRPILLHEFLHAYHNLKIADGFQNAHIRSFYAEAQNSYPNFKDEYFLSNAKEFFAVTASIYLFGKIPRPPFERSTIKKAQPQYYQYLESLFGQRDSK